MAPLEKFSAYAFATNFKQPYYNPSFETLSCLDNSLDLPCSVHHQIFLIFVFFLLKLSRNFSYQSTTQDEMTETIFRHSREEKSLFESFDNVDITVCEPVREVRTVSSVAEKGSSFKTPGLLTKSFERQRALSHPMHKLHKCALVVAFDN